MLDLVVRLAVDSHLQPTSLLIEILALFGRRIVFAGTHRSCEMSRRCTHLNIDIAEHPKPTARIAPEMTFTSG